MTTRWEPDTCKCIIEYDSIDDQGNFVNLVHVRKCTAHAAKEHMDVVQENRTKNEIVNEAAMLTAKDAHEVIWDIDPVTRKVAVDIDNLSTKQRSDMQAALVSKFPDKVKVD